MVPTGQWRSEEGADVPGRWPARGAKMAPGKYNFNVFSV